MNRLKNTVYRAGVIALAAAILCLVLIFIGGALAIAGIVLAGLVLVGGVMSVFGKKTFGSKVGSPITVVYTRVDEDENNTETRRTKRFP